MAATSLGSSRRRITYFLTSCSIPWSSSGRIPWVFMVPRATQFTVMPWRPTCAPPSGRSRPRPPWPRVRGHVGLPHPGGVGDHGDHTAPLRVDHRRQHGSHRVHHAVEVDLDEPLPVGRLGLHERGEVFHPHRRGTPGVPGVVHQDVDGAAVGARAHHRVVVGDVEHRGTGRGRRRPRSRPRPARHARARGRSPAPRLRPGRASARSPRRHPGRRR